MSSGAEELFPSKAGSGVLVKKCAGETGGSGFRSGVHVVLYFLYILYILIHMYQVQNQYVASGTWRCVGRGNLVLGRRGGR